MGYDWEVLAGVSRSCIDQIQYVGTVSCFHLFDVMVAYGSLIDKRVYITGARGVDPDTEGWTGRTQGDSSETPTPIGRL